MSLELFLNLNIKDLKGKTPEEIYEVVKNYGHNVSFQEFLEVLGRVNPKVPFTKKVVESKPKTSIKEEPILLPTSVSESIVSEYELSGFSALWLSLNKLLPIDSAREIMYEVFFTLLKENKELLRRMLIGKTRFQEIKPYLEKVLDREKIAIEDLKKEYYKTIRISWGVK